MPNPILDKITIDDIEYDLVGNGGGHVIEKSDGTDMTQRSNLQFVDAQLTDDSTNDRTKVENVKIIQNESELVNLPDGIYMGAQDEAVPFSFEAEDISYDNITSQLEATNVQAAIDELSQKEAGVQSDWNETDDTKLDYIKNKPTNLVQDANYVHTDNNYTSTEKTKLGTIAEGAEVNVQSDWSQTDNTADDYIKNKPTIPDAQIQSDWNQTSGTAKDFIKNKPTLGSASALDIAASGDASATQVVKGDDSRLSDARTPVAHTHTLSEITDAGTAASKDSTSSVTAGSTDLVESGAVKTAIDNAISGAYKHAGTKTCAELISNLLIPSNNGNVYNITDSGITTADFIEGAGIPIRAGDNVGIAKISDSIYKFDLLSGFIDTSNFVNKSSTSGLIKNDGSIDTTEYAPASSVPAAQIQSDWSQSDSTKLDYIKNKPTLGTASAKNVPSSGDAGNNEVVLGNDSRLTDARNAADVYSWAKAENKPSYTKSEVGLSNVDNTSDATKKSNFTGSIASGDTGFVTGGDVYSALGDKVDKVEGKGLSTNDYTTTEKNKLAGIASGAEVNVQSDWNQTTTTADDYIKNKPANLVQDASYVHTDNNYTSDEKTKLDGISTGANKVESSETNGNIKINGTETQVYDDSELQGIVDTDTTTATGNPLNFSTKSAQNAVNTDIVIDPVQDLHGYDKPWVGGAGKNLLPMTVDGIKAANPSGGTWSNNTWTANNLQITILVDEDDNVIGLKLNTTAAISTNTYFYLNPNSEGGGYANLAIGTAYYLNGGTSDINVRAWKYDGTNIVISNGQDASFTLNSSGKETGTIDIFVQTGKTLSNVIIYPMIRLSTETDATFQPYTNIASISGRTEIGIEGCGKNLCDEAKINRSEKYLWYGRNGQSYIPDGSCILDVGIYTISLDKEADIISVRDSTGEEISRVENKEKITFTNNVKQAIGVAFVFRNESVVATQVQIELDQTTTSYSPYTKSTDLTISLGQTVYGGTLDVEKGELVVDRGYELLDGSSDENWLLVNNVVKQRKNTNMKAIANDQVAINNRCNMFDIISDVDLFANAQYCMSFSNDQYMRFRTGADARFPTVADWETYLSNNPMHVCYELSTPITLQLTPNKISLLEGVNNISTTGDKITLTYRNGKVATLSDLLDLEKKLTDEEPYGFIEHMSILDPAQRIEYIGKNKNYSPMTINLAGDHLANYNEWYDFPVIKENKPYMIKADGTVDYALDPNDYTKKFDGSASDVANTSYTGGAFAWIPKTYKREFTVGDDRYVYISNKKLSDEYEAIGFIDENGLEHDGAWIPMFYGTEITQDGTVKIMTLATGAPTQNRNTDTQKTYLTNANPDTLFFGGAIVKVLTDIMIMLGKNSDIQAVFGTGNMSGGNGAQYMKNNACINGGAFYGTTTNNVLNKAFHSLVLLTQNQWQRDPYTLNIQGEYVVSPYYKYDLTGDSYVKTGVFVTPSSSNNWVYPNKSVSVPHWGAEPVGPYSGSTTTGWADGQYTLANQLTDTTVRVVLRFAYCHSGRDGGLRAVALSGAASGTGWSIGASPLLLSKGTAPQ